ncbi:MAG: broad specificity phosphatase PhoE [Saprospiraceae bacterium]|jgi:broad specificity phosphatase PhoE
MRILIGLFVLFCIACQPKDVSTTGKYITNIDKNVVLFVDGSKLELANCKTCKIIYLVRHAEKDTVPANNPILTEEGYSRSHRLAQIFKSTRLDAVYSTLYNRTMHTVDSLTTMKGLSTQIYQPKDLKDLSEKLLAKSNANMVLISGHSNTTPAFASTLMGEKHFEQGFDESDYDNLLIVNVDNKGEKKLYQLRFNM